MATELDVLGLVSARLTTLGIPFMLTGSFALAYYATSRMTRDLNIVVALGAPDIDPLVAALSPDFFIDAHMARAAVQSERLFNLMHLDSGIKVDLIVRKASEYRHLEFERRRAVSFAGIDTLIVSPEDLVLSKLVWANESGSELQIWDVRQLLAGPLEIAYIREWAAVLGVTTLLEETLT